MPEGYKGAAARAHSMELARVNAPAAKEAEPESDSPAVIAAYLDKLEVTDTIMAEYAVDESSVGKPEEILLGEGELDDRLVEVEQTFDSVLGNTGEPIEQIKQALLTEPAATLMEFSEEEFTDAVEVGAESLLHRPAEEIGTLLAMRVARSLIERYLADRKGLHSVGEVRQLLDHDPVIAGRYDLLVVSGHAAQHQVPADFIETVPVLALQSIPDTLVQRMESAGAYALGIRGVGRIKVGLTPGPPIRRSYFCAPDPAEYEVDLIMPPVDTTETRLQKLDLDKIT